MYEDKKKLTIIAVLLIVFAVVLGVFFVLDEKEKVIERKTGFDVPSYCTIEDYRPSGSIFRRTSFEAKIRIDTVAHMNEVIQTAHGLYGDDFHEIPLAEYNIQKYTLFSGQKIVPNPSSVSWVIVGRRSKGSVVMFVCMENSSTPYVYVYYNE
ncbi:MAG: hypothetical protein IKD90_07720 [Clostridiales bacterium]|nr:hypothetical protein [Clostridiales bacterium]